VRVVLPIGLVYVAVLLSCREWRVVARAFFTHIPWRQFAKTFFRSFPTASWRGAARLLGLPIAWCFSALIVVLLGAVLLGIEIVFSPKAIYCQAVHLSRRWRGGLNGRPDPTPPHAGALAMPHPGPMSFTDARSRLRLPR
jgi:hypothetical protein